jgi:16S rRNA (adenine(1408)-N(1))-methyltransferase
MADASARAARPPVRGGLPNALFAVAAAERPPSELTGRVDELTIRFPWGSLLRGALALDDDAAAGIAALVSDAGSVEMLLSVTARDEAHAGVSRLTPEDRPDLEARWRRHALCVETFRPATAADLASVRSTWSRRLVTGRTSPDRDVWRLDLRPQEPRVHR